MIWLTCKDGKFLANPAQFKEIIPTTDDISSVEKGAKSRIIYDSWDNETDDVCFRDVQEKPEDIEVMIKDADPLREINNTLYRILERM